MRMMIILLARICKMSWFDHPELQTVITEITQLFNVSPYNYLENGANNIFLGSIVKRLLAHLNSSKIG